MVGENKKLCPYDTVVPFECDLTECNCDPEICSRYVQHLIANLDKYKKVNNGR